MRDSRAGSTSEAREAAARPRKVTSERREKIMLSVRECGKECERLGEGDGERSADEEEREKEEQWRFYAKLGRPKRRLSRD